MSISHSNVNKISSQFKAKAKLGVFPMEILIKISSHIKDEAKLCVFSMGMSIKYPHILKLKLNLEYFPWECQ